MADVAASCQASHCVQMPASHGCYCLLCPNRASSPVETRVKRSLNLPAGQPQPAMLRRHSAELPSSLSAATDLPQLAGCSRKRFEAELVSPPMPRAKSSRKFMEDHDAADIMSRLHLQEHSDGGLAASRQP